MARSPARPSLEGPPNGPASKGLALNGLALNGIALTLALAGCAPPPIPHRPAPEVAEVPRSLPPAAFVATLGDDTVPGDPRPGALGELALESLTASCPTELAAPYDASQLKVGWYWYGPGNQTFPGGVGCLARPDGGAIEGYYDPRKPVLLYVHGWQPASVRKGLRPGTSTSLRRDNFWFEPGERNVADAWLRAGWNVAAFHWTQLADEHSDFFMPFSAQAKVWVADYVKTDRERTVIGMRWMTPAGYSTEGAPTSSAGELLYAAYRSALAQWAYAGPEPVRVIGHSLGAQMALALAGQAYRDPSLPPAQRPGRLVLADPYWSPPFPVPGHHYRYLAPDPHPAARSARIAAEVQAAGGVIEWLKSSPLLDLGGDNNAGLLRQISRAEVFPDYLLDLSAKHGVAPRWYLWALDQSDPAAPKAGNPLEEARRLMEERARFAQWRGRLSPAPGDDAFTRLWF